MPKTKKKLILIPKAQKKENQNANDNNTIKTKKALTPEQIKKITRNIDTLGIKFQQIMDNPNLTKLKKNRLIQNILLEYYQIQKKIPSAYYPSITNPLFNKIITEHPLFAKYRVQPDPQKDSKLVQSFQTNKDLIQPSKKNYPYFTLSPVQKFLRNFMGPSTPYRGLFVIHGTGVGKTCTGLTIAEHLKQIVDNVTGGIRGNITILRADEFKRQILDMGKIRKGTPNDQCVGLTYLDNPKVTRNLERCTQGKEDDCKQLETKVMKEIKQYYNFSNSRAWAADLKRKINYLTKNLTGQTKERKIRQLIRNQFDNCVLIIDEAHDLRESGTNGNGHSDSSKLNNNTEVTTEDITKLVPTALNMVVKYAQNLRLILMTATPMFDKPSNIIGLLNYLLMNDKRPLLSEHEIFNKDGELKVSAIPKLIEASRGYISYMRGNDPFNFPLRLSPKYTIPDHLVDLKHYPKLDFWGNPIKDTIKYLELVECPLHGNQLKVMEAYSKKYSQRNLEKLQQDDSLVILDKTIETELQSNESPNEEINNNLAKPINPTKFKNPLAESENIKEEELDITENVDIENSVSYSDERQASNFIYQTLEETNQNIKQCYGPAGLKGVSSVTIKKTGITYKFNDPDYGKRFLLPELQKWSAKIAMLIENIKHAKGPVFVYSFFIPSGVIPLAFALEMNGFQRYKIHGTPLLQNPHKSSKYMGDYIILTGDPKMSSHAEEYLNLREKMIDETSVKVLIGSGKASEGLNLFGFREVHILDPWANLNKIEQSIGRVIRQGSHKHLPPKERNVSVYLYASTFGKKESIDLLLYKISEKKAIHAGEVEKILKENAIDCEITEHANSYSKSRFPEKVEVLNSHGNMAKVSLAEEPHTKFCFYQDSCDYKCVSKTMALPADNKPPKIPFVSENYEKDIEEYANKIKDILISTTNVNISDLQDKMNLTTDKKAFQSALLKLLSSDEILISARKIPSKIVLINDYLRLIPVDNLLDDLSIQKQLNPYRMDPHKYAVNLQSYLAKLDAEKKEILESHEVSYKQIMSDINKKFEIYKYLSANYKDYQYNVELTDEEIMTMIFNKLTYSYKLTVMKKMTKKILEKVKLLDLEVLMKANVMKNIITYNQIYPSSSNNSIYGFIIASMSEIELYKYQETGDFILDLGNIRRLLENLRNTAAKTNYNKIHGYLIYENRDASPSFKIVDLLAKGEKKSVKGISCNNLQLNVIQSYLYMLYPELKKKKDLMANKIVFCNDIELGMMRFDLAKQNKVRWYFTPEEYLATF